MSLQKLATFFKENHHEVMDYWLLDDRIKWIKIASKRTGEMFMVNVFNFHIKIDGTHDWFKNKNHYILQDSQPDTEVVQSIYYNLKNLQNRFLFFHGNGVYESHNICYQATNLPSINHLTLYLVVDLEWFYDNIYVVSHEIRRLYDDIATQNQQSIQKTIRNVSDFIRDEKPIHRCITNLLQKCDKHRTSFMKCRELFISLCKQESETNIALYKIDDSIHPGDMTFKGAVHRQYSRKKLMDKLEKVEQLKTGAILHLNYFFASQWNYLLQASLFCNRINRLMEDILSMVFQVEKL